MVKKKASPKKTKAAVSSVREPRTSEDFKTAALIVSVTINVIVLIIWLIAKLSNKYDEQLVNFFF
jgi:hypothetical protein